MSISVSFPGWRGPAAQDLGGVNFALALSRLSGLPIEFTYLYDHTQPPPRNQELNPGVLCGLSVVDADINSYRPEGVCHGSTLVPDFDRMAEVRLQANPALQRLAMSGRLSLGTRILEESQARSLGLLAGEDAVKITGWLRDIPSNQAYYSAVPIDLSLAPVHAHLMRYAHSDCHFYAFALAQATEGTPVMFPSEHHSLVHHGGFVFEDVWGYRDPVKVSIQYGARSPDELSAQRFQEMMAHFRWKLGGYYQAEIDDARRVVDMRLAARKNIEKASPRQSPSWP